jgi:hypothetical protein
LNYDIDVFRESQISVRADRQASGHEVADVVLCIASAIAREGLGRGAPPS